MKYLLLVALAALSFTAHAEKRMAFICAPSSVDDTTTLGLIAYADTKSFRPFIRIGNKEFRTGFKERGRDSYRFDWGGDMQADHSIMIERNSTKEYYIAGKYDFRETPSGEMADPEMNFTCAKIFYNED